MNPDVTVLLGLHKNVLHGVMSLQNLRLMFNGCLQRYVFISASRVHAHGFMLSVWDKLTLILSL